VAEQEQKLPRAVKEIRGPHEAGKRLSPTREPPEAWGSNWKGCRKSSSPKLAARPEGSGLERKLAALILRVIYTLKRMTSDRSQKQNADRARPLEVEALKGENCK
jgi:hypothetical protein